MNLKARAGESWWTVTELVRERISGKVTRWTLLVFLAVGIPNFFGYTQFWWNVFHWTYLHFATGWMWLQTTPGKWLFVIICFGLIAWDQRRITRTAIKPIKHNVRKISGRTLQLRDEMQRLLDDLGPRPKAIKLPGENDEDYLSRTLNDQEKWLAAVRHRYALEFAQRVERLFHECALHGCRNDGLWMRMRQEYQTPESFEKIVGDLTWMAKHVDD